jgi:hypothetical protein
MAVQKGAVDKLSEAFAHSYNMAESPEDAALFLKLNPGEGADFYFSPKAATIFSARLDELGATACDAPSADGAKLKVGHESAGSMLG